MWSKPQKAPVQQNHLSAAFGGTSPQGEAVGRLPLRGAVGVSRLRGVWEVSKKKEPLC